MSDSELPRGITEVSWRNKADKRRTIKYRVRVSRKTGKWDELFDTLDEAKKCLAMTKSPDGMLGLTEREARDRHMAQAVANYLRSPGLRHYVMQRYVPRYIGVPSREERKTKTGVELVYIVTLDGQEHEVSPTKWRTVKTNVTRIESILKTVVRWYPPNLRSMSGVRTPPSVSIPSVSGVTSSKSTSFTSPFMMPP